MPRPTAARLSAALLLVASLALAGCSAPASPPQDDPSPPATPTAAPDAPSDDPGAQGEGPQDDAPPLRARLVLGSYDHGCGEVPCMSVVTVESDSGQWTVVDGSGATTAEGTLDGKVVLQVADALGDSFDRIAVPSAEQGCDERSDEVERTISVVLVHPDETSPSGGGQPGATPMPVQPAARHLGTTTCDHDWPQPLVDELLAPLVEAGVPLPEQFS